MVLIPSLLLRSIFVGFILQQFELRTHYVCNLRIGDLNLVDVLIEHVGNSSKQRETLRTKLVHSLKQHCAEYRKLERSLLLREKLNIKYLSRALDYVSFALSINCLLEFEEIPDIILGKSSKETSVMAKFKFNSKHNLKYHNIFNCKDNHRILSPKKVPSCTITSSLIMSDVKKDSPPLIKRMHSMSGPHEKAVKHARFVDPFLDSLGIAPDMSATPETKSSSDLLDPLSKDLILSSDGSDIEIEKTDKHDPNILSEKMLTIEEQLLNDRTSILNLLNIQQSWMNKLDANLYVHARNCSMCPQHCLSILSKHSRRAIGRQAGKHKEKKKKSPPT